MTVYELPLQPNNTASATFLHKSVAVRSADRIFIMGAPAWRWLGEYVTLGRTFYSLILQQDAYQPQLLPHFLPYRILEEAFFFFFI